MILLLERLLRRAGYLAEGDRIIEVRRWLPSFGPWPEIGWPAHLMETRCGDRKHVTPIWFPRGKPWST